MAKSKRGRSRNRRDFTNDDVIASREYDAPVQCGDCYSWYDASYHATCPNCGALETVGMR